MRLARRRVVVDVPASAANLGAGFDALAIALEILDRVTVEALDEPGVEVVAAGEGAADLPTGRDNRFIVALETGLRWALGEVPPGIGWRVEMHNDIPLGRGLGSSAAAVVGGLVAADALSGRKLEQRRLLSLAAELEGHPDNAGAALHGGFVVVATVDGNVDAVRLEPPRTLRVVLFIPDRELSTSAMRGVLPREVPFRDAVHNVGRAALAVAAIAEGRLELLAAATEDRLHEQYRAALYPELPLLVRSARDAGAFGACLSGAGSTILAFTDAGRLADRVEDALARRAADLGVPGTVRVVAPRSAGAIARDPA